MDQSITAKKVLCIEDEHFISELYTRALTKAGYNVTVSFDGNDAIGLALSDEYDIILLDIMLPNITGTDILKQLRGNPDHKIHGKIIITTNLELDDTGRAAIENMADGYLVKAEVTPSQLVEFLKQLDA